MAIDIPTPIPDITIGSTVITHSDWENNTPGAIADLANALAERQALIEDVGTLFKAITGDTTLSSPESTNISFVFSGALAADAHITFDAGFVGIAQITNNTTGGFSLICGLATGDTVTIPPSGSAMAFCDGDDFSLSDGIVRTATGASIAGDLSLSGNLTVGGNGIFTGGFSIGADLSVLGDGSILGDLVVNDTITATTLVITGQSAFTGNMVLAGTLRMTALPTSASGLDAGTFWNDSGTLKVA